MCLKAFFRIFPKRYFLAILSFIVVLLQISMRTIFTMSLAYLTSTGVEQNGTNLTDVAQNSTSNERIYWSTLIYQQVIAGYFYGYVVTQIPGGLLSQRFPAYKVFGYSCFVSFLLFLIIPFVILKSWEAVLVIRVLQGLVEGVSLPAMNAVLTHWARSKEKTRPLSIVASGAYLRAAVGLSVSGRMIHHLDWPVP